MNTASLVFPTLQFGGDKIRIATVVAVSRDKLTTWGRAHVNWKTFIGTLVADSVGKVYRISNVQILCNLPYPHAKGILGLIERIHDIFSYRIVRVEIEFEPEPVAFSTDDLKRFLLDDLQRNEHLHEQAAHFRLDKLKTRIQAGKSIPQIIKELTRYGFAI